MSHPVLLVEDKDSLRTMLRHALAAQGHTVVEARDQPEAEAAEVPLLDLPHPARHEVVVEELQRREILQEDRGQRGT